MRGSGIISFCQDPCIYTAPHLEPQIQCERDHECEYDSNALVIATKIQTLSEEKAAHEGFMLMRTRQQEDERNQFRKAWKRRRSLETAMSTKDSHVVTRSNNNKFMKLRRLQRYGQWASTLTTEGTVLTCRG